MNVAVAQGIKQQRCQLARLLNTDEHLRGEVGDMNLHATLRKKRVEFSRQTGGATVDAFLQRRPLRLQILQRRMDRRDRQRVTKEGAGETRYAARKGDVWGKSGEVYVGCGGRRNIKQKKK